LKGLGGLRGQLGGWATARQRGMVPPPRGTPFALQRPTRATQPYRRARIPGAPALPDARPPTAALDAMRAGRPLSLPNPMDVRRQLARQARRRA
jgi:hypothetical protein